MKKFSSVINLFLRLSSQHSTSVYQRSFFCKLFQVRFFSKFTFINLFLIHVPIYVSTWSNHFISEQVPCFQLNWFSKSLRSILINKCNMRELITIDMISDSSSYQWWNRFYQTNIEISRIPMSIIRWNALTSLKQWYLLDSCFLVYLSQVTPWFPLGSKTYQPRMFTNHGCQEERNASVFHFEHKFHVR